MMEESKIEHGAFNHEAVANAIAAKGLTQSQVGRSLGIDRSSVHRWLSGLTRPDIENLHKLAKLLNIPMETFFR